MMEITVKKYHVTLDSERNHIYLIHMILISLDCHLVVFQKSREANRDLQVELDQVLQQAQDPNSKGNSLFAEVILQLCYNYRSLEIGILE